MTASRFADHGDAHLHYLDSGGDDRGAPIVLVPGMTDVADDYIDVLGLFGRRTVVVELRGHGRSSAPSDCYDLATLSGDVGAVVDAVTDGPVHLVTFSRGTSYAVAWALEHADRIRSISIGDYTPDERTLAESAEQFLLEGRWRGRPVRERLDEAAAIKQFRAARSRSFWEPLAELGPPLLVVRARQSPIITDEDWARYAQLFPGAQLVEFTDSPHDIFRPDRGRYPLLVRDHADRPRGRHDRPLPHGGSQG
jgi:non-heme chloroperoxidase